MEYSVFNLEFPNYVSKINISGYQFERIENYKEAYYGLMHKVKVSGSIEYPISKHNTGTNQITATVKEINKPSVLPWEVTNATLLNDIILLLTLFTGRNIFIYSKNKSLDDTYTLVDPRIHEFGGSFHLALPNTSRNSNSVNKSYLSNGIYGVDYKELDFTLECGINQVIDLISSTKWQEEYEGGYHLFLYKQSLLMSTNIEATFVLAWTIWENLYAVLNRNLKTESELLKTSGKDKIEFILEKYFYTNLDKKSLNEIERIVRARNRLVHFGKKPNNVDNKEMILFIRATEHLVARTLELTPSQAFNTGDKLKDFLKL